MSELLKNWINKEIVLSKVINNISNDFQNGYLFAELLFKMKQIPKLSLFKNTNNHKDIIFNFCHLQKNLSDLGIILDEKSRDEIMNANPYTAQIYLFKIKQVLSNKNINLEQLKLKHSTTVQNLYNKLMFKNDNEKYLHSYHLKHGLNFKIKERFLQKSKSSLLPFLGKSIDDILNEKYRLNGTIYNELKAKYNHLDFSEKDIEIILDEMKMNEKKLIDFKDSISSLENKRKLFLIKNDEEIKKKWELGNLKMKKIKLEKLREFWSPAIKYKLFSKNYFERSSNKNIQMSANFDNNLKFLVGENDKNKKEVNSEIIMFRMRNKLAENIKNKKDKEKRERKRLREEQELTGKKINRDNINNKTATKEINLKPYKSVDTIKIGKPNDYKDFKVKNDNSNGSINNSKNSPNIIQNIEKEENEIRSRNKINNKFNTESTDIQKISKITKYEDEKQIQIIEENEEEKFGITKTSCYSKLSANDYGLGLFNEYASIHNADFRINDRLNLFKTLILPLKNNDEKKKFLDMPKVDLNENNKSQTSIQNNKSINIEDKSDSLINYSNEFNKDLFFKEIEKYDYKFFSKEYQRKVDKFERKKNLIEPIVYQLIDLTECISNYKETKNIELVDNPKWDELTFKLKENLKIDGNEEDKSKKAKNEEDGIYVFDYGDKLTNEDDKRRLDYINYTNMFNDLIIPNDFRGKKMSYPELYKDFYIKQDNHDIDIKDYEPNLIESENLYLPLNSKIRNFKFGDIIENILENKYNYAQEKRNELYNIMNKYEKKGKYYYLPIKIVLNGYPLSGKKTQCHLIKEKYKGIKIYEPQKILRFKMREYLEIKAAKEQSENTSQQKPKPKKDEKTLEERIKDFKPILKIIKPYIEFLDKVNREKEKEEKRREKEEKKREKEKKKTKIKKKKGKDDENSKKDDTLDDKSQDNTTNQANNITFTEEFYPEKEELLSDIYMKLILYQMNKDFPTEKNQKNKFMKNISDKYKEYLNLKEKIKDLTNKVNEEKLNNKEMTEKNPKNKKESKVLAALNKELDNAKKNYETTKNSLYVGFIIINFPKNLSQAEKFEKYFTGYVSDFEKGLSETETKLYNYSDIIDINTRQKKSGIIKYSCFDLFIEFKVTSEEMNRRYKGAKYDSLTAVIYHNTDNPPPKDDKKVESRLTPGIPYISKEEVYLEKANYEVNMKSMERLYRAMSNGFGKVYRSIDQMNINYLQKINNSFENALTDIIFNNYYNNIELIFNYINNSKKDNITENSIKNNDNKEKSKEDNSPSIQIKDENSNLELNNSIENLKRNLTFYDEIIRELDEFHLSYQTRLKNLNHFIFIQKDQIITYLNSIQNTFIKFLNRKTNKLEIANIYIQKYNNFFENNPEFTEDSSAKLEFSENIKDVAKSIWLNIQNKKIKDIKYLHEIKGSGKAEKECNKFFEYISSVFELEIEKYLISIEIIIKYYLSKFGLLSDIYGIFDNTQKMNKNNKYLFKVNHKEYLFKDIEINNTNNNDENEGKNDEMLNAKKDVEDNIINKDENNEDSHPKKKKNQSIEEKINILFMNGFKVIIKEDELKSKFIEIIRNYIKREKDKSNSKNINIKLESSPKKLDKSLSSNSKKKLVKRTKSVDFQNEVMLSVDEVKNQIIKEKRKLKYRLVFLKNYSLSYLKNIKDCFNEVYNTIDELIIISVRFQNNALNEFIKYLEKELKYFNRKIDLNDFEFDSFSIFDRNKVDANILYKKFYNNYIFNADGIKKIEAKLEHIKGTDFIIEEEMSYNQLYAYNLDDLMIIYNNIKNFGIDTCNYYVKYGIVYEILLKQYFNNKKYGKYEFHKMGDEFERNVLVESSNEENNGICNKILFASNIKYINFLNNFVKFNNNFININELFTSLLILGSQLINSDQFLDLIREYLPENKKSETNIFLTKEEFMELPMWFERDDYLNILKDSKEKEKYSDIYSSEDNKITSQENKPLKINAVKEAIFEINSDNNILELKEILELLNKLNSINASKRNINDMETEKSKTIENKNKDFSYLESGNKKDDDSNIFNEESNKYDSRLRLNSESKKSSSIQSGSINKNKISDSRKKEEINNIFNILFN